MTIYFSGHTFKYEIEGIVKLFIPLQKFQHIYENVLKTNQSIITRRKIAKQKTYLWVYVDIDGKTKRTCVSIMNNIDDYENECERLLCICVFKLLQKITGITPKWGILTGIRPVAYVQKRRNLGYTDQEIADYFKAKYLVTAEKLDLSFLTATVQKPLLDSLDSKSYS